MPCAWLPKPLPGSWEVLDRKGTLERGKDADMIALDRDLNVRAVWAMGELVEGTNKLF